MTEFQALSGRIALAGSLFKRVRTKRISILYLNTSSVRLRTGTWPPLPYTVDCPERPITVQLLRAESAHCGKRTQLRHRALKIDNHSKLPYLVRRRYGAALETSTRTISMQSIVHSDGVAHAKRVKIESYAWYTKVLPNTNKVQIMSCICVNYPFSASGPGHTQLATACFYDCNLGCPDACRSCMVISCMSRPYTL